MVSDSDCSILCCAIEFYLCESVLIATAMVFPVTESGFWVLGGPGGVASASAKAEGDLNS